MNKLNPGDLLEIRNRMKEIGLMSDGKSNARITVHMGTCGIASGAKKIMSALISLIEEKGLKDIIVNSSGCVGLCSREPMITIELKDKPPVKYADLTESKLAKIFENHILKGKIATEYAFAIGSEQEEISFSVKEDSLKRGTVPLMRDISFFNKQHLIALRNRGLLNSESIDEYIGRGGYEAISKVLGAMKPFEVITAVKESGLRGRGGAGFPTGRKWEICSKEVIKQNVAGYVVCNGDEGDPGAFMDRSIIESDPHSIIEGMLIGAYAIGAFHGYIYIRNEYPLAVKSMQIAIESATEYGLLGKNILGSGFDFNVTIQRGAGAFVCGEETSLIASLEGKSPEPRQRPPYPAQSGVWGKPTNINNVETWATVPEIINRGAKWFSSIGTESSKGTKVFSLVGKVKNTGLVEVPMGITLREIIYEIGGGIIGDKNFKAVQTGGPSGGCIPSSLIDIPIDYEKLTDVGSMMGSGGMIVMDETDCMVDVARYFVEFLKGESCGKCLSCRDGITAMYNILQDICEGRGSNDSLETLEDLADAVKSASQCGLGATSPNPVLSTIKYFKDEYIAHINERKCPAGVCKALITYSIPADKCTGCMLCIKNCPTSAIIGEKKKPHTIITDKCIKCGVCFEVCKFDAVRRA